MKFQLFTLEPNKNFGLVIFKDEPWFVICTDTDINLPINYIADLHRIDPAYISVQPIKALRVDQTT